jgi:hypothetical protein
MAMYSSVKIVFGAAPERPWVHLRLGPDGVVHVLHEQNAGGRTWQGRRQAPYGGGRAHHRQHRQAQSCPTGEELRGASGRRDGEDKLRHRGSDGGEQRLHGPRPDRPSDLRHFHSPCFKIHFTSITTHAQLTMGESGK